MCRYLSRQVIFGQTTNYDLECADDVALPDEDLEKMKVFADHLNDCSCLGCIWHLPRTGLIQSKTLFLTGKLWPGKLVSLFEYLYFQVTAYRRKCSRVPNPIGVCQLNTSVASTPHLIRDQRLSLRYINTIGFALWIKDGCWKLKVVDLRLPAFM